jgi:uncharacterized protein YdaT
MPWTPEQYRAKHNKKLSLPQAKKAADMAAAMISRGVPEGEAIATANKHASNDPRKGLSQIMKRRPK